MVSYLSRKFKAIPSQDHDEDGVAEEIHPNPDYPYGFPVDIWHQIVKYLTFLQITHLSQVNRFFHSFCRQFLKKFKKPGELYIRMTPKELYVQHVETKIEGKTPRQVCRLLLYELDECLKFPIADMSLEQEATYFSQPWSCYWNAVLRHTLPATQFLRLLTLKNIHCSKSEFLRFIIPCSRLNTLNLTSVNFNDYIFIAADIYDQVKSLETLQVSQCPDVICDKDSKKFFRTRLIYAEKNIYTRKGSAAREFKHAIPSQNIYNFEKIGYSSIQILSILFAPFHCTSLAIFYGFNIPKDFYHLFVMLPIASFLSLFFILRFSPLYYHRRLHLIHRTECYIQTSVFTQMSSTQILISYILYAIAFFFLVGIYIPVAFQSQILTTDKFLSLVVVSTIILFCGICMVISWFWNVLESYIERKISSF